MEKTHSEHLPGLDDPWWTEFHETGVPYLYVNRLGEAGALFQDPAVPMRKLCPQVGMAGQLVVALKRGGRKYSRTLGIVMLETFGGKRPDNLVVHYIDGNKKNCRIDNLRWVTKSELRKMAAKTQKALSVEDLFCLQYLKSRGDVRVATLSDLFYRSETAIHEICKVDFSWILGSASGIKRRDCESAGFFDDGIRHIDPTCAIDRLAITEPFNQSVGEPVDEGLGGDGDSNHVNVHAHEDTPA